MERTELPMDLTEILKRAWSIYKENLFLLLGIVAIVYLPSSLFGLFINLKYPNMIENLFTNPNPSEILGILLLGIPLLIYMLIVAPAALGASVKVASEGFLGKKISFSEAYKIGFNNYFAIIVPLILAALIIFFGTIFGILLLTIGVYFIFYILQTIISYDLYYIKLFLLIVGSLVIYFFLMVSFVFITQAVIVDEKKFFSAISRSARLARKDFWRVLGILIVFLIINVLASLVINIPGILPKVVLGPESTVGIVFSSIFSFLGTLLVTPFSYSAITVLYYDLKIRQEGFSVEGSNVESPVLE